MKKKIAVIGTGFVGQAFIKFIGDNFLFITYDINDNTEYPKKEIDSCDLAVICVQTPMNNDGSCNISYVENAISKIDTPLIMIKSTIPPGTTDKLIKSTGKHIVFSPEYIGESKYFNPIYKSMKEIPFNIVGGNHVDVKKVFEILENISGPYCVYYACSAVEAEIIKYMENSFFATKVAFTNQFYDIAKIYNANWHKIREGWLLDERIGRGHTTVFADNRGFSGKCLPKDISAITKAAEDNGYTPGILRAVIDYNNQLRKDINNKE